MELILFLSPTTRTGTTTLSHYLANSLVQDDSKELVLVIEWTKFTGRSVFLNSNTTETNKQLSTVVYDKSSLNNHLMASSYNRNVFYICQNMYSHPLDMDKYLETILIDILKEVRLLTGFKYVIIDLPSYFEPVKNSVLSKSFPFPINSIFSVLDEDAISFKHMKDFTEYMNLINTPIHNTSYIINKTTEYYVDYLNKYKGTDLFPAINLLKVPYINQMTDNCNRGAMFSFGNDKQFNDLMVTIDTMIDIVKNKRAGYNLSFSAEQVTKLLEEGYSIPELSNKKYKLSKTEEPQEQQEPQELQPLEFQELMEVE